jgi:hypothetical protein
MYILPCTWLSDVGEMGAVVVRWLVAVRLVELAGIRKRLHTRLLAGACLRARVLNSLSTSKSASKSAI